MLSCEEEDDDDVFVKLKSKSGKCMFINRQQFVEEFARGTRITIFIGLCIFCEKTHNIAEGTFRVANSRVLSLVYEDYKE